MIKKLILVVIFAVLLFLGVLIITSISRHNDYVDNGNTISFSDDVNSQNKTPRKEIKRSEEQDIFYYIGKNYIIISIFAAILTILFIFLFFFLSRKKEW